MTTTYDVVAAWVTSEGTQAALYHFADESLPTIYRGLPGPTSQPPPRIEVSGRMLQAGAVYMRGDSAMSTSAPWPYTLVVESGTSTAALVAVGADRMLIRRGIDVSSPAALDAIDLSSDGTPTVAKPLTLVNGPTAEETLSAALWWSGVGLPVSFATFRPPPASLVGSETLQMTIEARTERELRYCYGRYTDDRTSYTLPAALTGVSFTESGDIAGATWGTRPPMMDGVALDVEAQTAEGLRLVTVEASPSWLAATGATSLAFDVSPPGFDPSWKIDLSGPYYRALVTWRNGVLPNNIDYLLSQVAEEAHGAVARPVATRTIRPPGIRQ
ncbi:MAG: hypothetical protein HOV81_41070 [Kofleriaceae bacterium]|nr:hypothetical protein [Kofleriaceae bacterium]